MEIYFFVDLAGVEEELFVCVEYMSHPAVSIPAFDPVEDLLEALRLLHLNGGSQLTRRGKCGHV